jgi:uncharacterized YigZ family protein
MRTIIQEHTSTTEVKKSKFIAYLLPIKEYEVVHKRLKRDNPKANHIVYALRYLNEYNQIVESSSDDGEPKGSAGVPALNVLRGYEMINCTVFIVRYFGGIKLGTGGMARAYSLSIKTLLQNIKTIEYERLDRYSFESSYSQINQILHLLKELNIDSFERIFGTNSVEWSIEAREDKIEVVRNLWG